MDTIKFLLLLIITTIFITGCDKKGNIPKQDAKAAGVICTLDREYIKEDLAEQLKEVYTKITGADEVYIMPENGLLQGAVKEQTLSAVFPDTSEVYLLELSANQFKEVFQDVTAQNKKESIKLAVGSFYAAQIIDILQISKDKISKTGKKEKEILKEWLLKKHK